MEQKHGPWRVASNLIGDKKMYAAYRLIDIDAIDHSGNREYASEFMADRDKARDIADRLNAEAGR
ncbi:MAG: hypothetical protein GX650_01055 [Clostridiales bacterium]|nr:hypothetical protein [Clostridiales bacterium]